MRSFPFAAGDEVLVTDLGYGAVTNAARHAATERGATVRAVAIPCPVRDPEDCVAAIVGAVAPRTRLAIVDHVTSESALVLPVREIVAGLKARGVSVLVDGAHAPGALELDVPSIGADWYIANLHKWACAPRGCGFLWAPAERQPGLHPAVISWGYGKSFLDEFDLVGTRDPSPMLAAPEGLSFMHELGLAAMRRYQHELAWEAGQMLAARWGTTFVTPRSMIGSMVTVPLPARAGAVAADAQRLRDALLYEDRIEVQMHAQRGELWARVSAQVYVEIADIERLAEAVLKRIQ
ncbi:MAG: aminotransferase class V-fold PLP-dependent enzyme [Candidatus Eisenbacteria bacterium]